MTFEQLLSAEDGLVDGETLELTDKTIASVLNI